MTMRIQLHPLEQTWEADAARMKRTQVVFDTGAGEVRVKNGGEGWGNKRKRKPLTRPRGQFIVPSHFARTAVGRQEWLCRLCSLFDLERAPDWVILPNKKEALEHERGCKIHRKKLTELENFLWEIEEVPHWVGTPDTPALSSANLSPVSDDSEDDFSWRPVCYEDLKRSHVNARDAPDYLNLVVQFWLKDTEEAGPADPEDFIQITESYDPGTRADLEKKGLTWKDFYDDLDNAFWNVDLGWADTTWNNNWEADNEWGNVQQPNEGVRDNEWDKNGWGQDGWGVQPEAEDGWVEAKGKVKGKRAKMGQKKIPAPKQKQTPAVSKIKTANLFANLQVEVDV